MTRAGFVFTGINVLLALIFGMLLSDLATTRVDSQKKIDGVKQQIEDAKKALAAAETKRAELGAKLVENRQELAAENRLADALKSEWDNRLTTTTDLLQDARERSNVLKQTLIEIQSEVTARSDEIKKLQGIVGEGTSVFDSLVKRNQVLSDQLAAVESKIKEAESNIARDFKIVTSAEAAAAERRVAAARN